MEAIDNNDIDKTVIQNILNTEDEMLFISFPRPIYYRLSNIIKLRKDNPNIENTIASKQQEFKIAQDYIDRKKDRLDAKEDEIQNAECELLSVVKQYGENKTKRYLIDNHMAITRS